MAKRLEWKVSFQRTGNFPLDVDSLFPSVDALKNYVVSGKTAHIGQIVAVTSTTEPTKVYKIDKTGVDSGFTEITSDVYKKSEVDELISNAGKVKDVKVGGSSVVDADGVANITMPTVDSSLNTTSTNAVQNRAVASKFGDYYTKGEVDSQISSVMTNISIFEMVESLDSVENPSSNKIYVVKSSDEGVQNLYIEYIRVNGAWEKVGEFKADTNLDGYATEDWVSKNFLSNDYAYGDEDALGVFEAHTDSQLDKNSSFPVQNKVITSEFEKVREEISAATGTDMTVFLKKSEMNTINGRSLFVTGSTSENIEVGTIRDITVNDISVVTGTTANINLSGYVPVGTYNALLDRVIALEALVTGKTLVTTDNISEYAITELSTTKNADGTSDIEIIGTKGSVEINLNSITNIAFEDAEEE